MHYPLLQELYTDAFHSKIQLPEIERRFTTASLGCEHIGFIAIHKPTGKVAAYYGVFPVKLKSTENTLIQSAQSGDTMTHSDHRMKGLFIRLAKECFNCCRGNNIKIVFGFPNENSLPGFIRKLDWIETDRIVRYDLKLKMKTVPFSRLVSRSSFFRKIHRRYTRLILGRKNKVHKKFSAFKNLKFNDRSQVAAYPLGYKWECRFGSSGFLSFSKLELLKFGLPFMPQRYRLKIQKSSLILSMPRVGQKVHRI